MDIISIHIIARSVACRSIALIRCCISSAGAAAGAGPPSPAADA
jgi:hypothetical protein